jgi:predicted glycosyltransferase involved in capsule biosynthesis
MLFLSFIVGFRNRDTERVTLFLERLKAINSDDFELIFVDYGSDESVSENVKKIVSNYSFANYQFFNSRGQNWNRSKCLNYGFGFTKGQYIFTSDIDFLYDVDFISILKKIVTPTQAFYFQVGFLSQKQSENIHSDSKKYEIESYSNEDAVGALLISREMFNEVGGYDEFYEIWGIEDNDMLYRIKMTKNKIK